MTPLDRVRADAAAAAGARDAYRASMDALRVSCAAADRAGESRNDIVRAAEGGMSRRKVFETLGAEDLITAARAALRGHEHIHVRAGSGGRVLAELSPSILLELDDDEEGEEDDERYRARKHREGRILEDAAYAADAALREHGLALASGRDGIAALAGFEDAEVIRAAGR